MLKLKNINASYKIGKKSKTILDDITLDFKNHELVFILGPSGSGKSTLLNIIAGNLKCDSGEVWLNNICISKLPEKKLNTYHETIIGNIFQDYNLIDYMNVWDNIMLGKGTKLSKNEIDNILKELNIYNKKRITVSKLSGGEKQRVAIARALVNNPAIILADEPTGSLDSATSNEVMEILKRISQTKLVIVVSHNNNLANIYADRIINIKDGKIDYIPQEEDIIETVNLNKRKTKHFKIIKLALKNLWLKKMRTLITAIAVSLGIVSMFMVLNLYHNFNFELSKLEYELASALPITVQNGDFELPYESNSSTDEIIIKDKNKYTYTNRINKKYLSYLNNIKEISYITYHYDLSLPLITDNYNCLDNKYFYPIANSKYINENYDIIYGHNIKNKYDILLKIDENNNADSELLNYFGFDDDIAYQDIIGRKIKIITNNDYYLPNNNYFIPQTNYEYLYQKSNIELTIVGIIKEKEITNDNSFLYYDETLINDILDINQNSDIVTSQILNDYNVLGLPINKNDMLSYLGYNSIPESIDIYTTNITNKQKVISYLEEYNKNNQRLIYTDTMSEAIDIVKQFITIISTILILFSIVAITISSLMTGILTNVRVLERKKEIGILKSLGYSKHNIRNIFNLENIIIGLLAIILSTIVVIILSKPLNDLMNRTINIDNIFEIKYHIMFIVFLINLIIIKISGSLPARRASRIDIVSCIYNR